MVGCSNDDHAGLTEPTVTVFGSSASVVDTTAADHTVTDELMDSSSFVDVDSSSFDELMDSSSFDYVE